MYLYLVSVGGSPDRWIAIMSVLSAQVQHPCVRKPQVIFINCSVHYINSLSVLPGASSDPDLDEPQSCE